MKILIFSITYFPFVGGAEIAVREITDRIGRFEFDLITARLDKKLPAFEKIGNVNVHRVGKGCVLDKYLYPLLAYRKANKLHKDKKYDIAQAIMANWAGIAALFFKLKNKKVKYLLTMQSGDSDFFMFLRTWFWRPIYKMVYTKADFIQPISQWLSKRARKYGYKGEIKVVPNGVDVNKFKVKSLKLKVREKLGIEEDEKVIITASRLVEKNGVGDLIKAIGLLKDYKVKLLIAGTGKLEGKLKKLAKDLGLQNNIIFLGHINQDDLPKYFWASDIFCRPSLTEGFGNVFVESMAAGLPVVATPVGGIVDFLEDGKTGVFCKVKDTRSIAEAIRRLLNDRQLYDKVVASGRELVKEKYDWDIVAGEMEGIYRQII